MILSICILARCSNHYDNWIVVEMFGFKSVIHIITKLD